MVCKISTLFKHYITQAHLFWTSCCSLMEASTTFFDLVDVIRCSRMILFGLIGLSPFASNFPFFEAIILNVSGLELLTLDFPNARIMVIRSPDFPASFSISAGSIGQLNCDLVLTCLTRLRFSRIEKIGF